MNNLNVNKNSTIIGSLTVMSNINTPNLQVNQNIRTRNINTISDNYIDNYLNEKLNNHYLINLGNANELKQNRNILNENKNLYESKNNDTVLLIKMINQYNDLTIIEAINPKYIICYMKYFYNSMEDSLGNLWDIYRVDSSYASCRSSVGENNLVILTKNINDNLTLNFNVPIYEYDKYNSLYNDQSSLQDDITEKTYELDLFPTAYVKNDN
jgi:hypothetical protein